VIASSRKAAFLSHSSEDHVLAEELCSDLEARGFSCWIAPRDVAPREPYALECLHGVAESSSLLLLASENALASPQVLSEMEQAHKRGMDSYYASADRMGTQAVVCLTAKGPSSDTPQRLTQHFSIETGRVYWNDGGVQHPGDQATFVPSTPPTLTNASNCPCQ